MQMEPGRYNQQQVILGLAAFFVSHTSAGALSNYSQSGSATEGALSRLYRNGDVEEALSALAFETFGEFLVLDRMSGNPTLRVGQPGVDVPPLNRPTEAYSNAVAALPSLAEQGDGFKSFIGLALMMLVGAPSLTLLDEPEAFLHPGQARALGRWIAKQSIVSGIQVILATHDRDVLLGLLEGGAGAPVNLVRVSREGDNTRFSQLSPDEVQEVWDDPVLRYSNVLQGLFHRRVVVCEGDADCRFFGAAVDQLAIATRRRAVADDILFVPSGGKQRVPAMLRALGRLQVDLHAIVDFDALNKKSLIRDLVESTNSSWSQGMDGWYTTLANAANNGGLWPRLKQEGLAAVPSGEPTRAAIALLDALDDAGVHVLRLGEMEAFDKTISEHGAGWVSQAIENDVHTSSELQAVVEPFLK
jgi:hypothetical protein